MIAVWDVGDPFTIEGIRESSDETVLYIDLGLEDGTEPGEYTADVTFEAYYKDEEDLVCEASNQVEVTVVSVKLNSISGENENGHAKVLGTITPSVIVDSWKTLVNGTKKQSGSAGFTAGNFYTWIDQDWFFTGNNTVTFEATVDGATCSGCFTANVEGKGKTATDILGGALVCEGLGVTRWINREYSAFYDKVTYSITASGKIRHVKYADVLLDWRGFPGGETPIIPHKNRYSNTASGDHFIQNMVSPDPPVITPARTILKQARTYKWTETEALKAKAKCISYILNGCPATPTFNAEVEVDIND